MEYEYLSEESTISINKFLGEGSTSHVYQCSLNNHQYAIKLLKDLPSAKSSFLQETQSLNQINHPNITNLINSGISKVQINNEIVERPYIILEYAEKGELFNYIYHPKRGFTEKQARYIFKQILLAIQCCHSNNIAHLDLKTENIMLDSNWNIKLSDFGLSVLTEDKNENINTFMGTESFLAPEIINKKPYDPFKADIFALGVTLFIILSGNPPFKSARRFDIHYQYYLKNRVDLFWKIIRKNHSFSDEAIELLNQMFEPEPTMRIRIEDILNHPWMNMESSTEEEMKKEFEEREKVIKEKINNNNMMELDEPPFFKLIINYQNLEHSN